MKIVNRPTLSRTNILLFLLFFTMQIPTIGRAQEITYSGEHVPLEQVIKAVEQQSGYFFLYQYEEVKGVRLAHPHWEKTGLLTVLNNMAKEGNFSYSLEDKTIVLKKGRQQKTPIGQQINGRIVDQKNQPLSGATILLKSTGQQVIADKQGNFVLPSSASGETLTVSFTGFIPREIYVDDQKELTIVLQEDLAKLDEVVVVGYGVQKKANLTGAVATVQAKDLENRVVSGAAQALQGADPSLNITFGTGVFDQSYGINIRGVPSINGGTPLILADGIEVNLSQINPHDIESISVLKDASASAIYGAKASSGVILITTKQGKDRNGQSQVSYNGRIGFSQNTTSTDFIRTGYDHVSIVNQFYNIYQGTDMALYSEEEMQMLKDRQHDLTENPDRPWTVVGDDNKYYYYGNTDWYGYFYRRSRPQQEHNLSANGGTDKLKYYVSGRYWSQDGIFNIYDDRYNNYSMFSKIDAKIKPWLRYTGTVNFNSSNYNYAGYYDEQQTIHALQSNILSTFVPFNPDGTIMQYPNQLNANSPIGAGHGGFLSANTARNSRGNTYIVLSNRFDADLGKDFTLTGQYAYGNRKRLYKYRNLPFEYSRAAGDIQTFTSGTIYDYYQESHYQINDHNVNIYGTYQKTLGDHKISAVVGGQYENYRETNLSVKKTDLLNDALSSFSVATGEATIGQNIGAFRTLGFFGRANYDYMGKYLLEVSGRWDGTSRFSPKDRWGFFPSASAGWRISEEGFWQPLKSFWDDAKVRVSMGSLGNQQVDDYAYFDEITTSNTMNYTFDGATKAYYASVSDPKTPSLTWETVTTYNLGTDLSFLKGRLGFTGDYFIRNTKNMLAQSLTLPAVYGANTPQGNVADLQTKGWELTLSWNDQIVLGSSPLHYNVAFTLGDYTSTITKYNNPDKLISEYYVGRKLGEIWGYRVKGLFATDADAADYQARINDKAVNNRVYSSKKENYLQAGDVEFIDVNGDGIINQGSGTVADPGDMQVIGNSQPRYNYSIRMGADWHGFDLSVFLQGVGQRDWFPSDLAYNFWGPYSFPSLSFISSDFMSNVWSADNPDGYFPKARGYASYSSGALGVATDRYLQHVGYLRLKNVTLGYTFPLGKQQQNKLRVYLSGENLFYWSKLKQHTNTVDPELTVTSSTYSSNSGVGYDFSKSYIMGVNLVF